MFLAATPGSYIGTISIVVILIIGLGLILKRLHQPYIICYILVGSVLGTQGLGIIEDKEAISHLGELGIILLMFFIGMEISLPKFLSNWRIALGGTTLQVLASVVSVLGLGTVLGWSATSSVILGFVIALSSSAVIIKLLEEKQLINSQIGQNVLSILLAQDILIVPLLIMTSFLGGEAIPTKTIVLMIIGGLLMVGVLFYIYFKQNINLPFSKSIEADHELQVFVAILFCFGGALISSLFGLSPALGAFIGGMLMHAAKSTQWIHDTLHSFRILFVAFFFIDIGLQIDFGFIKENWGPIFLVLVAVYLTNHLLNSFILRLFKSNWKEALIGGALLAQIGELSFLISSTAQQVSILDSYGYQFTISLISLTLIISPFWIILTEFFLGKVKSVRALER